MVRRWVLRGCKKMRKEGPASMLSLLTAQDYAMAICSGSYPYLCLFVPAHPYSILFITNSIISQFQLWYTLRYQWSYLQFMSISLTIMIYDLICQFVDDSSIVDHDHDIICWSIQDIQVPHLPSHLGRLPLKISEPMRSMTPTPCRLGAGPKCYGSPILWKKSWNW